MRQRITLAILLLVAAALVVTTVGSLFFVRRAAVSTGQQELSVQARAISETLSQDAFINRVSFERQLKIISDTGAFSSIQVVKLYPGDVIVGDLPSHVAQQRLNVPALESGRQTTGHTRNLLAFSAIPTRIKGITDYVPVLIVTRQIHNPVSGVRYFLVVGAIALGIAAIVAAFLARRMTRPLLAAVSTTGRIASGDLDATMPIGPREDPEFAQLAESINAMGATLVRARDQERQFLLSVSHELRTPLTSIRGYADAVIDGATDDPKAAAGIIGAEARRLERLVQDLLDLARLDADRFSLDLQTVDCIAVVRQIAEGARPRMAELGLSLHIEDGAEGPLWVEADADRLGQIIANLVENASSFADYRIEVGTGTADGRPTAWVVDDGPGIPERELSQVFQRHFTSDRVSGRRIGSGLGLAIVAELAAAMGADVRAESPVADERGTRMVVSFSGTGPVRSGTGSV